MRMTWPPGGGSLSPSAVRRVEQACDRFEDAWQAAARGGQQPRLEEYLGAAPEPERSVLLYELLLLELDCRGGGGDRPTPARPDLPAPAPPP